MNKNDRQIKVMARGLHPSCNKDVIITDLNIKGFNTCDAVNILKKERIAKQNDGLDNIRKDLPLFMFTFDNSESM